jgi:hypothetical protein
MLTVQNNLAFHLVIPKAGDKGKSLKLLPKGSVQVEKVTGPLKDAERNELVVIHYPQAEAKPKNPPKKKGGRKKKKR